MKCYHPTCTVPHAADFVRLESDEESCGAHLPDGCMSLLEGDADQAQGWAHVDCAWRCCYCDIYYSDAEAHLVCENCSEPVCCDCVDYNNVCRGCRDRAEERAEVRSLR